MGEVFERERDEVRICNEGSRDEVMWIFETYEIDESSHTWDRHACIDCSSIHTPHSLSSTIFMKDVHFSIHTHSLLCISFAKARYPVSHANSPEMEPSFILAINHILNNLHALQYLPHQTTLYSRGHAKSTSSGKSSLL